MVSSKRQNGKLENEAGAHELLSRISIEASGETMHPTLLSDECC